MLYGHERVILQKHL